MSPHFRCAISLNSGISVVSRSGVPLQRGHAGRCGLALASQTHSRRVAMSLMTRQELTLRAERLSTFETAARRVAERAVGQKEKFRWGVYQTMFGDISTMSY